MHAFLGFAGQELAKQLPTPEPRECFTRGIVCAAFPTRLQMHVQIVSVFQASSDAEFSSAVSLNVSNLTTGPFYECGYRGVLRDLVTYRNDHRQWSLLFCLRFLEAVHADSLSALRGVCRMG